MLRVYTYARCDTCRRAVKFLRSREIAFAEIPIRETPPTKRELHTMLAAQNGELRRLFNTSGADYKAMGLSARLPSLTPAEAIDLLAANGNLVKRPFAIGDDTHLAGFDETRWSATLS